jgi:hypothetical protein
MKRAAMVRTLAAGALAGGCGMAVAQGAGALSQVQPGQWQVHVVGDKSPPRAVCAADVKRLLQIEHGGATCTFRTISDAGSAATVRYVCPGAGSGMTELTVESKTIVRLHTQGVAKGAPYDVTYEARYAGACGTGLAQR